MSSYYVTFVNRDIPYTYAISPSELSYTDIFYLENGHHVKPEDFTLVRHSRECIVLNKDLKNLKEIEEIIEKVFQSKYFPEELLERFEQLTDEKSADILARYYSEWRDEIRKRELYRKSLKLLKSAKSLRISWKVKRNRDIIMEMFNIGFGVYDENVSCDWNGGAENAFMYGYLLGVQSKRGDSEHD